MDPRNPTQYGAPTGFIDHTPVAGVADIASRFKGTSVAQPELSFQANRARQEHNARQASLEAKSIQHAYRGKGDDWMSEFERMRRLEMQAARRAELEARENLHKWRGMHNLILAFQRAKLGLPLSEEQSTLLRRHAAEFNLPIMFTPQQIEEERDRALQELLIAEQQMLQAQGREGDNVTNIHSLGVAEGGAPPGYGVPTPFDYDYTPPQQEDAALSMQQGYASGFHPAEERSARPLPGDPAADAPQTEAASDEPETSEAEDLMTLITTIVQDHNRALALGELSEAIAERTGYTWGSYFEAKYGPLLQFLKAHRTPGYHILSYNKYLSLPGMPVPPSTPEATPQSTAAVQVPLSAHASSMSGQPPYTAENAMLRQQHLYSSSMPFPAAGAGTPSYYAGMPYPGYFPPMHGYQQTPPMLPPGHMYHPTPPVTATSGFSGFSGPSSAAMHPMHYSGGSFYSVGSLAADAAAFSTPHSVPPSKPAEAPKNEDYNLDEFFDPHVFGRGAGAKEQQKETSSTSAGAKPERVLATTTVQLVSTRDHEPSPRPRARTAEDAYDGVFGVSLPPEHLQRKTTRSNMTTVTTLNASVEPPRTAGRRASQPEVNTRVTTVTPYTAPAPAVPRRQSVSSIPPAPHHDYSRTFDVEEFARRAVDRGESVTDDRLTWQDFDILFRPILVHSFVLIKHGRSGLPKRHRFWMTNALNRLYWDTTKFVDLMKTGERHIEMGDVVGLVDGVSTDLLRRKLARGEIGGSRVDRFFSLVTTHRTFDLEALSVAQKKVLVRAFNFLIRHLSRPYAPVLSGIPPPGDSTVAYGSYY